MRLDIRETLQDEMQAVTGLYPRAAVHFKKRLYIHLRARTTNVRIICTPIEWAKLINIVNRALKKEGLPVFPS